MQKISQLNSKTSQSIKDHTDYLITQVVAGLRREDYSRAQDLPHVLRGVTDSELGKAETENPTQDDIALSVHLICRLQSEIAYDDMRISTGLYRFDYHKRIRILHALTNENAILAAQVNTQSSTKNSSLSTEKTNGGGNKENTQNVG